MCGPMFYARLLSRVGPRCSVNLLSKFPFDPSVMFIGAHSSLLFGVTRRNNIDTLITYSLTSFSYKGSYSISKGGALRAAPGGSPSTGRAVPPAKLPFKLPLNVP